VMVGSSELVTFTGVTYYVWRSLDEVIPGSIFLKCALSLLAGRVAGELAGDIVSGIAKRAKQRREQREAKAA